MANWTNLSKPSESPFRNQDGRFGDPSDALPFGSCMVDSQFRLCWASDGALAIFRGSELLIGRDFGEIARLVWPEPFATEAIGRFRHTLATGQPYRPLIATDDWSNGDVFEFRQGFQHGTIERLAFPDGQFGVIWQFSNEMKLRRSEAARRDAEARYLELFNAIEQGFCTLELAFDDNQRPVDYRFLEVSPSFEAQTGIADAAGRWMRELSPDQDQHWFDLYGRVAITGESVRFEQYSTPLNRWWSVFAFRTGDPSLRQVAVLFHDITERKRVESELRASEDRFRLLDSLGEATRSVADPYEVMAIATRMLGEHLRTSRCNYADVEPDSNRFTVRGDWCARGLVSIAGRYDLQAFGPRVKEGLQMGRVLVLRDVDKELVGQDVEIFHRLNIRAFVCWPLVREGRLHALMAVNDAEPRDWTDIEVATVREVCERSWAYIERVRSEAALRQSEERFRQLADSMPQIVWTARADGAVDYFNRRWFEYTGQPTDSANGDHGSELMPDIENIRRTLDAWTDSIRTGRPYEAEYRLRRGDGEYRWHLGRAVPVRDESGNIVRWFGTNTDIHDQKRAAELLAQATAVAERNAAELEALIEAMPHAVYFGDENGITRCNQLALAMLGASSLEDLQSRIGELGRKFNVSYRDQPERLVEPENLPFARALRGELASLDTWVKKNDGGGPVCIQGTAAPVFEDGRIVGAVAVNTDITDRVRAEDSLRQLAADLSEAGHRKDEFLATLAHELRNPLAPMRFSLELLKIPGVDAAMVRQTRDVMERQLGQLVRLVDDLLDVSRVTTGKVTLRRERVAVQAVIDSAVETSRPLFEQFGHALRIHLPTESVFIEADPTRLSQVLTNLLNNAAKYTPSAGVVEVSAVAEANEMVVRVTDNGVGISSEMLPKVFDLFTQVGRSIDRSQGGLGIGLSLVRKLVEMHDGTVTAESAGLGEGSTFTVRLPLANGSTAHAIDTAARVGNHQSTLAYRILVVDDNVDAAKSLALLFTIGGHETYTAHDGPAAIEAAGRVRPDVVFLDIGLPGMNGYEVAEKLRKDEGLPRPFLVALTGWGSDVDRKRSREAGFDFHLVKPAEADQVADILSRIRVQR
jgi:PAS domain S-box-containing protein